MPHARTTDHRVTFAVLAAGVSAFSLLQSMVNPVLPTIQAALHTDQRTVTWLLTAYLLSASVFTPIVGRVGDKVGKERMLVVALGALAVGSLVAALAPTIGVLIFARVLQGVGGGVLPLTFGIIRDEFPREKVAGAIGTAAALLAVGGALGLVVAGPLVAATSYHWLFWVPLVLTSSAAVAAWLFVPPSPVRTEGRIDLRAALLLSGWLVCLLLPISQGRVWGWASPRSVTLLVLAVVLCALWVRTEVRSDAPLIDMRMMRLPAVWTTNLVSLLFGVGMYAGFAFLPQFLQTPERAGYGFGASVTTSGLLLLPQSLATFTAGLLSGRLAARFGSKRLLVLGAAASALSQLGPVDPARPGVAGAAGHARRRARLRAGVRRDEQPGGRGRPAQPDRGGQRHERQHPHGRRGHRRRRARQRRHRRSPRRRAARRVRLHQRVRRAGGLLAGRRPGGAARPGGAPPGARGARGRGAPPRGRPGRQRHPGQRRAVSSPSTTTSPTTSAAARPLRRDAAANRERVLLAAAEVFHEQGLTAGLEDVARRAGVGVGTVYRRFPTREALLETLLSDLLAVYLQEAEQALARPDGAGLAAFVRTVGEVQATPRGCALRLWSSPAVEEQRERLHAAMAALVADAQRHGACREGVTVDDLVGIFVALRGVRETPTSTAALDWRRHLELCLAGLRCGAPAAG